MKVSNIDLSTVMIHGNTETAYSGGELCVTALTQNNRFYSAGMPLTSYITLPEKYSLPLRIDLRVSMDSPSMYLSLGKGHLTFGTAYLDNRRMGDIIEPVYDKPSVFYNSLEMNAFHDISVTYDLKFLRITVDGEERYFSKKRST